MQDLRYPVGRFEPVLELTSRQREEMIGQIAEAPARIRAALRGLDDARLDTPYREGGWTLRQVAHHVPDSHVNAYVRLKLALTEETPTIKPYDEAAWAMLPDSRSPVENSLLLLDSVHVRFVEVLRSLSEAGFRRTLVHPDHGTMTVDWLVAMYAWHGRHHEGHITSLRDRMNW